MIDINEEDNADNHKNTSIIEEDISIKDDFDKIDSFLKQRTPRKDNISQDDSKIKEDSKANQIDSKMLKEPIINKQVFEKALNVNLTKAKVDLSRLTYPNLKQIISKFGFYPEKTRMYMWKYLLSLPNDNDLYNLYAKKGIHPFYKDIKDKFPIADQKYFRKMQLLCSLLAYWSPHIGNVYYLPNIVFPFIKALPWDDLFIFEVIIALLNSTCDFWFECYPSPPNTHLTYCESIMQKECNELYLIISKQIQLKAVIWRMLMNIFSESFNKDNWLSLIDFLITYNHKPEMILYFAIAFILSKKDELVICGNTKGLKSITNLLFKPMPNSTIKQMLALYKSTLDLYSKYSKYQMIKYKPHKPFPPNDYPKIDKFPLDFLTTTARLKRELMDEASFIYNKDTDANTERKDNAQKLQLEYETLRIKEKQLSECYERMLRNEQEKTEVIKRELGLIMRHKQKVYEEIKKDKLNQLNSIEKAIKNSIGLNRQRANDELRRNEIESMLKKEYEQVDLKNRLMNEELNNYEYNSNNKMMHLLNQQIEEEKHKGKEEINRIRMKQSNLCDRLILNEKQIDEDDLNKGNEVNEAIKEYEIERKRNKFNNDIEMYNDQMKNYEIELKGNENRAINDRIKERERKIRLENDQLIQQEKDNNEYYYPNDNDKEISNPFNPQRSYDGNAELNEKEKLALIEKYREHQGLK